MTDHAEKMGHGDAFPPRDVWDIAAYDEVELVDGYRDYRPTDPEPGPNRPPAYRWGWANRRRDITLAADGYEGLRRTFIEMTRNPQ